VFDYSLFPMNASLPPEGRRAALAELRTAHGIAYRAASPEAFTLAEESVVRSGLGDLDVALGGGFPRGVIATLEGLPGSGRSAVAARLLAQATADGGLAALIEIPDGPEGRLYAPALVVAGVELGRLLVIEAANATEAARAADIVLRAAAFGVVVMPALPLRATVWTRLASLTHRANAVLVALGTESANELRYFASLRVRMSNASARFAGSGGLFCALAGIEAEASILKHKRAAPGRRARVTCTTFETSDAPLPARLCERATVERTSAIRERVTREAVL